MMTYSHGNNIGNLHFLWKVDSSDDLYTSQRTIEEAKQDIPIFHTRAMRRTLFGKFGRIAPTMKPAVLRALYRELTNDASAPSNLREAEIDERVKLVFEMEDPDVIIDLRHLNSRHKGQYDVFWQECKKIVEESVGTAVDDRRHGTVTHLACAMSVPDLREQVKARCLPVTNIPSESWLKLQFWPKNPHFKFKVHYTGKLDDKFMVQARQFRKEYKDSHYAAAIFRYQRELAIDLKDHSNFISIDDKHRMKVGEPGFPVAAAERGRRVLVSRNSSFQVGDHDFTCFGIVPSVCFLIDIPEEIEGSWYTGKILVGLKESAFEPSSPTRHSAELNNVLLTCDVDHKPVLFLYCDGGPDHRLTYLSVQLSLISLFLRLNLDFLCVCRTAPFHSWRNPVEHIMSIVNLGIQCIGLMKQETEEKYESIITKCKNMAQLRQAAQKVPELAGVVLDSISPVKVLLSDILLRLKLKQRPFDLYPAASDREIREVWDCLLKIDPTLDFDENFTKKSLPSHPKVQEFLAHCCQQRHYSFCVKKCGSSSCGLCRPPRLPSDVFSTINFLPDPIPMGDGYYKGFHDVYGTVTSEEHRPSLQKRSTKTKTLPFVASLQHVWNVNLMVLCEECSMWRLIYSPFKLAPTEKQKLDAALEEYTFTCGASLSDLDLPGRLSDVCVQDLQCCDPVEKLYYSMKYDPICVYCCGSDKLTTPEHCYPQCEDCIKHHPIKKRV